MNCIFFGDEVVYNGNDMPVAEIPGVVVFAVNELVERVPYHVNVLLPTEFTRKTGPEATKAVLENLEKFANAELQEESEQGAFPSSATFVARWKEDMWKRCLRFKCAEFLGDRPQAT